MGGPGNSSLDNHEGDLKRDSIQSHGRDLEVIFPDNLEERISFFDFYFKIIMYFEIKSAAVKNYPQRHQQNS